MIAHAQGKFLRGSPRKVRLVLDLIRGKGVSESASILTHVHKGCTAMISKVLHSAVSNAKQKGLTEEQLFISKVTADQGPVWKRFRAASFGRAAPILKRTTHLTIELDLKVGASKNPLPRLGGEAKNEVKGETKIAVPKPVAKSGQKKPSKKRLVAK